MTAAHHSDPAPDSDDEIAVWRVQRQDGAHEFAVVERSAAGACYLSEGGVADLVQDRADPVKVERALRDLSFFSESEVQ